MFSVRLRYNNNTRREKAWRLPFWPWSRLLRACGMFQSLHWAGLRVRTLLSSSRRNATAAGLCFDYICLSLTSTACRSRFLPRFQRVPLANGASKPAAAHRFTSSSPPEKGFLPSSFLVCSPPQRMANHAISHDNRRSKLDGPDRLFGRAILPA